MASPHGDTYNYMIITLPGRQGTDDLQTQLAALGLLGWQVVAIDPVHARIILKQQLT